jgi:hypothetical protein
VGTNKEGKGVQSTGQRQAKRRIGQVVVVLFLYVGSC